MKGILILLLVTAFLGLPALAGQVALPNLSSRDIVRYFIDVVRWWVEAIIFALTGFQKIIQGLKPATTPFFVSMTMHLRTELR